MRRTRFAFFRPALPMVALLLLGGCDWFGGTAEEAAGEPTGEVLEGSISDAMIPTDDLKSQPPVLRVQPGTGGAGGDAADTADSAVEGESTAPAEEAAPAEPAAAQ